MNWPEVLRSWPPLLATVALLVAGSWLYSDAETTAGAALLAAGLVTLGAWLATTLRGDDREDHL